MLDMQTESKRKVLTTTILWGHFPSRLSQDATLLVYVFLPPYYCYNLQTRIYQEEAPATNCTVTAWHTTLSCKALSALAWLSYRLQTSFRTPIQILLKVLKQNTPLTPLISDYSLNFHHHQTDSTRINIHCHCFETLLVVEEASLLQIVLQVTTHCGGLMFSFLACHFASQILWFKLSKLNIHLRIKFGKKLLHYFVPHDY